MISIHIFGRDGRRVQCIKGYSVLYMLPWRHCICHKTFVVIYFEWMNECAPFAVNRFHQRKNWTDQCRPYVTASACGARWAIICRAATASLIWQYLPSGHHIAHKRNPVRFPFTHTRSHVQQHMTKISLWRVIKCRRNFGDVVTALLMSFGVFHLAAQI